MGQEVLGHDGDAAGREALLVSRSRRPLLERGREDARLLARHHHLERAVHQRHAIGGLALEQRHVAVHAEVERDERAQEEGEDADVGHHEAGVVRLPRVALHHRAEDVEPQEGEDAGEPPRAVDLALHGGGAVLALVEGREQAGQAQRAHDHDGQPQGGQPVVHAIKGAAEGHRGYRL